MISRYVAPVAAEDPREKWRTAARRIAAMEAITELRGLRAGLIRRDSALYLALNTAIEHLEDHQYDRSCP